MTEAEFWSRVDMSGDCWEWQLSKKSGGYGQFHSQGKHFLAHRFAWELVNGPIPKGLCVCHHCDNPGCVRPGHLFVGTQADNIRDCMRKGRMGVAGERSVHAKVRATDVLSMRRAYQNGATQRALAEKYGMRQQAISRIVRGKRWAHIGGPIAETGSAGQKRKLSANQVAALRRQNGKTTRHELAVKYGVCGHTISDAARGRGAYAR